MSGVVEQIKATVASAIATPLKEGSKLPTSSLKEDNPQAGSVNLSELKGKSVIVGVPGAFSPSCSSQAPGYVEQAQKFGDKGIQGIYIIAVNDVFVTQAWKEKLNAKDSKLVHFLADDNGAWSAAAGMSFDATGLLGNHRSNRYAALIEDGVVRKIWQEDQAPQVTVTGAESVLQAI